MAVDFMHRRARFSSSSLGFDSFFCAPSFSLELQLVPHCPDRTFPSLSEFFFSLGIAGSLRRARPAVRHRLILLSSAEPLSIIWLVPATGSMFGQPVQHKPRSAEEEAREEGERAVERVRNSRRRRMMDHRWRRFDIGYRSANCRRENLLEDAAHRSAPALLIFMGKKTTTRDFISIWRHTHHKSRHFTNK